MEFPSLERVPRTMRVRAGGDHSSKDRFWIQRGACISCAATGRKMQIVDLDLWIHSDRRGRRNSAAASPRRRERVFSRMW
jgi:hypothetical protein